MTVAFTIEAVFAVVLIVGSIVSFATDAIPRLVLDICAVCMMLAFVVGCVLGAFSIG